MKYLYRARAFSVGLALLVGVLATAPVAPALAGDGVRPGVGCGDCEVQASMQPATRRSGATLSVNIAIVGLGMLWLVLMLRRIQQGAAVAGVRTDDLAGGVPQPAAGGH